MWTPDLPAWEERLLSELWSCSHYSPLCVSLSPSQLSYLQDENSGLRWQAPTNSVAPPDPVRRPAVRGGRAMSMYETGSGLKQYHPRGEAPRPNASTLTLQPLPPDVSTRLPLERKVDTTAL